MKESMLCHRSGSRKEAAFGPKTMPAMKATLAAPMCILLCVTLDVSMKDIINKPKKIKILLTSLTCRCDHAMLRSCRREECQCWHCWRSTKQSEGWKGPSGAYMSSLLLGSCVRGLRRAFNLAIASLSDSASLPGNGIGSIGQTWYFRLSADSTVVCGLACLSV